MKRPNKDLDSLELKRKKKPKYDKKQDPSRKNKKFYLNHANEHI